MNAKDLQRTSLDARGHPEGISSQKLQRRRRLVLDVTNSFRTARSTGIERVARDIAITAESSPAETIFVLFIKGEKGLVHLSSRTVAGLSEPEALKQYDPTPGDLILFLDLIHLELVEARNCGILSQYQAHGVVMWAMVYDLLPLQFPRYFLSHLPAVHKEWLRAVSGLDGAVCISQATAGVTREWLSRGEIGNVSLPVTHFRLTSSFVSQNLNSCAQHSAPSSRGKGGKISFLMIGTLEPRKGYVEALRAIRRLRKRGLNVDLTIVGGWGWKFRAIRRELARAGSGVNVVTGANDGRLKFILENSTALLATSFGEGFGLPLIEAAGCGLPLVVRDIPVFREVCGPGAFYFSARNSEDLANQIASWIDLYTRAEHPSASNVPQVSLDESFQSLLKAVGFP